MADEIDKGQASGDLAGQGDRANVRGSDVSEYDELGLDRRRVSEWREVRDAGEEVVEQAIQSALDEGRAPTKSDIMPAMLCQQVNDLLPLGSECWSGSSYAKGARHLKALVAAAR